MDDLKALLDKYKKPTKEIKTQTWQFEAIEAIKKLVDGSKNRSAIFKCFKVDQRRAKFALLDSIELGKPFSRYFFKVFGNIKK